MSQNLITVHEGEPLSKLRQIFEQGEIHHVPVVSGENLIGIVSWTDFLRISFGEFGNQDGKQLDSMLDNHYKIVDVMNRSPKTLPLRSTVRDAARILGEGKFHSIPIVDEDKLVGLVTSTDLVNYLVDL